ncbi:MAG: MBL fold metallo-hydrolase [Pirellulales bacterium]|nr:MBL fold metallo-hydrolase [Pirellulales bacterium]
MKLILLGTTGYHPNDRRQTACLMLPEVGILLDAGTALYRARDYLATPELDIFLTHAHLDHIVGVTFLFDVFFERSIERCTVHGAAEHLAAVREHLLAPALFPAAPPCDYAVLASPTVRLASGGRLTHFLLDHPGGAVGYRLDWPGHSLAYVTDTTARADAPYVDQLRGVDLLVHECYFPDEQREWAETTGHSHTSAVAELARAAGVGRLVLVHVNPLSEADDPIGLAAARRIFPRVEIGEDRMELDF